MRNARRRIQRWAVRFVLSVTALGALYLAILFYPAPLFAHEQRFGRHHVYSDEPIPAGMGGVIEEFDRRLAAMEHRGPRGGHRIYLCGSRRRYDFLAFLAGRGAESLAIGLSVPNETFVSMTRLRHFAAIYQGRLRHTRFEANLAGVVAHEIAHFNSARALGLRPHLSQPLWKSEGWAEYQANLAAIHADPDYDLHDRVEQLLDDDLWAGSPGAARRMWEAQLLVEFLGEVKGYRLADLARAAVTEASAREAMMAWHASRQAVPEAGR